MVFTYCKCCQHLAGKPEAAANFYRDHFIPTGWKLYYSKLSECLGITLTGRCDDCHGELAELIPLPNGLTEDGQLKAIYNTMRTVHPYDEFSDRVGYYGGCEARSWFYGDRDKRSQWCRSRMFLNLFHDYDRERVRLWLEKNFPPQKHTEVFRDTGGSMFTAVVRMARENGDFAKAEAILDYVLPGESEDGDDNKVELTAYEFDFEPVLNYGCEGIYIDCFIVGKFDQSGRSRLHVGTLKTLRRDLEAAKIMGELCGVLLHYAFQYVNENLHRYTPDKRLEDEHYQMQLQARKAAAGDKSDETEEKRS